MKTRGWLLAVMAVMALSAQCAFAASDAGEIASALGLQRSNVSAVLNDLLKENRLVKTNTRPVLYMLPKESESRQGTSAFAQLIGSKGSLRKCVQLAKAAVLYPGSRLNYHRLKPVG